MSKIVILGDPNSIWIKSYIKEVLSWENNENIIIISDVQINEDTYSFYNERIELYEYNSNRVFRNLRLEALFYCIKLVRFFRNEKDVNAIHVHYVSRRKLLITKILKGFVNKIIVSFWGSDLLRKSDSQLKSFKKYLKNIDCITVGSKQMMDFFVQHFDSEIIRKTSVVRFGVNGLDAIYNMKKSKRIICQEWGMPYDKIIITIGYNGAKQQNHLNVLNEIRTMPKDIIDKICLVLPITYGLNDEYYSEIKTNIEQIGCEYFLITEYMNSEKIAELCHFTDLFIHAQETDSFSASVQEYLCAGKLVVNPNWIVYNELKNAGIYYWEYNDWDDLKVRIQEYISSGISSHEKELLIRNKQRLFELKAWDDKWKTIYN